MGFEVTATHVIFFVAFLTAGSAGMGAFWANAAHLEEARREQDDRAVELVHTNLTLSGVSYSAGSKRFQFTVTNSGQTVLDVSDFVFIVDGAYTSAVESVSISGASGTDILVPGDSMAVRLRPIENSPTRLTVVAGNGFQVFWRS